MDKKTHKIDKEEESLNSISHDNSLTKPNKIRGYSMKESFKKVEQDENCPFRESGSSSKDVTNCKECGSNFGRFASKKKCHFCKYYFCKKCINPKKIKLPPQFRFEINSFGNPIVAPVSVCDSCFSYIVLINKKK